ncbi:cbb3-type cytochrome oxidase maturation protein [Pseudomonas putida S11]|nr:cbb3-type cytochrome oxidase maturation protein [Pseudomonas putida S11]
MDSGQYDDLESPAHSILFDDQDPRHQAAVKPDDSKADTDKENPPRA